MGALESGSSQESQSVTAGVRKLFFRMAGVVRFKYDIFQDIRNDNSRLANGEAVLVASLVGLSLAAGVSLSYNALNLTSIISSILSNVALVLLATAAWSGVAFFVGTKIFKGTVDFTGFARQAFFSVTPGLFLFLAFLLPIRPFLSITITAWVAVINTLLVKRSMGLTSQRSILTVFVSAWIMFFGAGTLGLFS